MLPGRELIDEIEQTLCDLEADECELSGNLEKYIIEHGDYFLDEWREIKRDYSEKSTSEKLFLMLDTIQSEANTDREKLQARIDFLDEIDDELDNLIGFDEEDSP